MLCVSLDGLLKGHSPLLVQSAGPRREDTKGQHKAVSPASLWVLFRVLRQAPLRLSASIPDASIVLILFTHA